MTFEFDYIKIQMAFEFRFKWQFEFKWRQMLLIYNTFSIFMVQKVLKTQLSSLFFWETGCVSGKNVVTQKKIHLKESYSNLLKQISYQQTQMKSFVSLDMIRKLRHHPNQHDQHKKYIKLWQNFYLTLKSSSQLSLVD